MNIKPFTKQSCISMAQRSLLKTLWKKEKKLIISIFYFSCNVYYPVRNFSSSVLLPVLLSGAAFDSEVFEILLFGKELTHSHTMTPFDAPGKQAFWKHSGKRRNCSKRAISPSPTVFSTRLNSFLPFSSNLKLSSANSFSLEESKICRLVMV